MGPSSRNRYIIKSLAHASEVLSAFETLGILATRFGSVLDVLQDWEKTLRIAL